MEATEQNLDVILNKIEANYQNLEFEIRELEEKLLVLNRQKRSYREANEKGAFYDCPGLTLEERECAASFSYPGAFNDIMSPKPYPREDD